MSKKGFASMDPQRQREIASMGGRAAHAKGTAHKFNSETGRLAAAKPRPRRQSHGGVGSAMGI